MHVLCCILEIGSELEVEQHRSVEMTNLADILLIADCASSNIMMSNASVFALKRNKGYNEVAKFISTDQLIVRYFKFVILLCGRADLRERDEVFKRGIHGCIQVIKERNPKAIILLTATIPNPVDDKNMVKNANYRAGYMSRLTESDSKLEFARPGKRLLKPGGVIREYFDEFNNLNTEGLVQIRRGLNGKFACAQL